MSPFDRYRLEKSLRRLLTWAFWGFPSSGISSGFRARFKTFVGLKAAERVCAVWRPSIALDSQKSLLRLWMVRPRSCISWCSVTARRLQKENRQQEAAAGQRTVSKFMQQPSMTCSIQHTDSFMETKSEPQTQHSKLGPFIS